MRGYGNGTSELGDDPARPWRHHGDPRGQVHRLADGVGDEQRRRSPRAGTARSSSPFSRSRVISSSAPNGSSNRNTRRLQDERAGERGPHPHAHRTAASGTSPRSRRARRDRWCSRPLSGAATSACRGARRGARRCLATVRHGNSVASWKTYPRLSRGTEIEPLVLVSRPEAMRRRVDFPHPDGPTMVTNSPGVTANVTSSTACVPSGKTMETWSKCNALSEPDATVASSGVGSRGVASGSDDMTMHVRPQRPRQRFDGRLPSSAARPTAGPRRRRAPPRGHLRTSATRWSRRGRSRRAHARRRW